MTIVNRARHGLPFIALALAVAAALPPAGTYARRYAIAQAGQFAFFAVVVPALLVIGRPARWSSLRQRYALKLARPAGPLGVRAAATLLPFVAFVIAWRLPATQSAVDRYPALTTAELVTLTGAGTALWLQLAPGLGARQPLPRPLRAAMAAAAVWTMWALAYITGMSGAFTVPVQAGAALSAADDRQMAVAVLWAVPAISFVPVIYGTLMRWLGDRGGPDRPMAASALPGHRTCDTGSSPRPPRGWRR
jgi:hypothetical protein